MSLRAPRTTTAVQLVFALLGLAGYAALHLVPFFRAHASTVLDVFMVGGLSLIVAYHAVTLFRPHGVDLEPDAVVVRGWFRRQAVDLRDVAEVRLERETVVLACTDGRRVTPAYPSLGTPPVNRRRFEADHDRIRDWWQAHRGVPG